MFNQKLIVIASLSFAGCIDNGASDGDTTAVELSSDVCPAGTPAAIAPPSNRDLSFVFQATGVQEYQCLLGSAGYAWTFIAPDAKLLDDGVVVGHHFAGPTWQYEDGSEVVGAKLAAATVSPTAIPWLLLNVVSHEGPADGKLTNITSIKRMVTKGGLALTTGCDASHANAISKIPYTASYFFYRTKAASSSNVRCGG